MGVDKATESLQILVSTDQTKFTLPPGLLQRGLWYRFEVTAIAAEGANLSTPNRLSLPRADASLFSGRFTP